jgi:hypothetical protein
LPLDGVARVRIQADDETAAAIAAATARLKTFQLAGSEAGAGLTRNFSEARGSAALLGEEVGVKLNRHLRSILATGSLLGPLLETAFPVVAAIAFGEVIFDAGKRLYDFATNAKEAADAVKKLVEHFKDMEKANAKSNERISELRKEFETIGVTGSGAGVIKIQQLGQEIERVQAAMRRNEDQSFGLAREWDRLTDSSGKLITSQAQAAAESKLLAVEHGRLSTRVAELAQQQYNLEQQAIADKLREDAQAAEKAAAAFQKLQAHIAAVSTEVAGIGRRVFDANHDQIEKIRREWQETFDKLLKIIATESPKLSGKAAELILPGLRAMNKQIEEEESKLLESIASKFNDQAFPIQFPKNLNPLGNVTTDFSGFQRAAEFAADLQHKMQPLVTLNDSLSKSFDNMFQDIALNTRGVSEAFASMTASVASSLLQMIAKMIYTATIGKWLQSMISGIFGGAIGGISSTPVPFINATLPDHLAAGGPVMPNVPYFVGEVGKELFVPHTAGRVIPNDRLGGGGNVQIIINNQSSQPVSAAAGKPTFDGEKMIVNVVLKDLRQNGPIRQAFNGSF